MSEPLDRGFHIGAQPFAAPALAPALYLVATPVGNLGDVTLRALQVLAAADVIYCEDTRVTVKLLERYGIRARLKPYHDHNAADAGAAILAAIAAGQAVALASDAGTPLLSDPGFPLVRDAVAAGVKVEALPGASALLPALQLSALPTDRFTFLGFLPQKAGERLRLLTEMAARRDTLVAYESPHRVVDALADIASAMGGRAVSVSREISKLHEETLRGSAAEVAALLQAKPAIKGEFVIVISGREDAAPVAEADVDAAIDAALATLPASKAAAAVARETGLARDVIYARILARKARA